jgi:hypothetical protein
MNTSTPKDEQLSFLLDQKRCPSCKKVLPITEFHIARGRYDGRRYCCKSCASSIKKNYYRKNYLGSTFRNLKDRARKKNIPVEVTVEYLKSIYPDDMICPVLGIKMEVGDKNRNVNSPSIDKIIPEKGYVPGNVIIVSMKANRIKADATPDEIIKVGKFYKKLLEEIEDGSKAN